MKNFFITWLSCVAPVDKDKAKATEDRFCLLRIGEKKKHPNT